MPSQFDNSCGPYDSLAGGEDGRPPSPRRRTRIYAPPAGDTPSAMPWQGSQQQNGIMGAPATSTGVTYPTDKRRVAPKSDKGIGQSMRRMVAAGLVAGILGVIALFAGKALQIANKFNSGKGLMNAIWTLPNPHGQFPARTQRVNILLIGKDYNHTNKGILYTKASRSDTLIFFSLDIRNKTVSALSIPRDTYVAERRGKINAAFAQGGAPMAVETVGKLLGVYPDYYIALKPDGVKELVDEVGGVEVTAIDAMKYDDNWGGLHIDLPAGTYSINGEQAVGYTRFRKSNDGSPSSREEGDARRMARQQNLVRAMVAKAKTPEVLMRADKLIDTALGQVETNLSPAQLLALATIFRETEPDRITSASLMGDNGRAGGLYVFKPDQEKTELLVDWLLRGDLGAANALTVVSVQNGTRVPGAARRLAEALKEGGFDARSDGNAPKLAGADGVPAGERSASRIVYHKASHEARARTIGRMIGVAEVVKEAPAGAGEGAGTDSGDAPADVSVVVGLDVAKRDAPRRSARRE